MLNLFALGIIHTEDYFFLSESILSTIRLPFLFDQEQLFYTTR